MPISSGESLFILSLQRAHGQYRAVLGFSSVTFDALVTAKETFLHENELAEYNGLKHECKQLSFLQSRYLAKKAVGAYTGEQNTQKISIANGVFGQPFVRGTDVVAPAISMAHTANCAACLVFPEEHPMGIDVELIRNTAKESICSQMTRHEMNLGGHEEENTFYTRLWTSKEALSKVLKTGLLTPFSVYEILSVVYLPNNFSVSTFTNFSQYKALNFPWQGAICAVVLPEATACQFPPQFIAACQQ